MKTKEFIRQVEELGLVVQFNSKRTFVRKYYNSGTCVVVDERHVYSFDSFYCSYDDLEDSDKSKLFNLLVEYASTPLEKRKEEKKYYLKFKDINDVHGNNYLNLSVIKDSVVIANKIPQKSYRTIFTERDMGLLPYPIYQMLMQGHLVKEEVE